MVKLRLKRFGKKREATYRIVATDSRGRRDSRPLQEIGFYNPRTKATTLATAEVLKWLRVGAQPTDVVKGILTKANVYELLKQGIETVEDIVVAGSVPTRAPVAVLDAPAVTEVVEIEATVAEPVAETSDADPSEPEA